MRFKGIEQGKMAGGKKVECVEKPEEVGGGEGGEGGEEG